jgi:hypothetical protein
MILAVHVSSLPAMLACHSSGRVVELRDGLDAVHEARKLLELSPLVVDGRDRRVDIDGLLDLAHAALLRCWISVWERNVSREPLDPEQTRLRGRFQFPY